MKASVIYFFHFPFITLSHFHSPLRSSSRSVPFPSVSVPYFSPLRFPPRPSPLLLPSSLSFAFILPFPPLLFLPFSSFLPFFPDCYVVLSSATRPVVFLFHVLPSFTSRTNSPPFPLRFVFSHRCADCHHVHSRGFPDCTTPSPSTLYTRFPFGLPSQFSLVSIVSCCRVFVFIFFVVCFQ